MFERLKDKIWDLLKNREVSLAMIYDDQGRILWHRGRELKSKTLARGEGFCRSLALKTLQEKRELSREGCLVHYGNDDMSESAIILNICSLIIVPFSDSYFLYVDSGTTGCFSDSDRVVFETVASLLGEMIEGLRRGGGHADIEAEEIEEPGRLIRERIIRYAIEEEPVLLLGETGVGKNHIAEKIHIYSGRRGRFVIVHTPGIPESLLEAQLFGHVKGAFTGAIQDYPGLVHAADGGTLFFDEIAEVTESIQAKLMRFIDTKTYRRLGDSREYQGDVRLIFASNRELKQEVREKRFREDLFHRLQVISLYIPPLRERREEISRIIDECQDILKGKELTPEAREVLTGYDWPGNVRELINALKRARVEAAGELIDHQAVRESISQSDLRATPESTDEKLISRLHREIAAGRDFWQAVWQPFMDRDLDRRTVRCLLKKILTANQGNFRALGMALNLAEKDYHRFMTLMYKYRLDPREPGESESP